MKRIKTQMCKTTNQRDSKEGRNQGCAPARPSAGRRWAALAAVVFVLAVPSVNAPAQDAVTARTDEALIGRALSAVDALAGRLQAGGDVGPGAVPGLPGGPRLSLAVSMSLSADYRRMLAADALKAGVRLAVRGLPVPEGFEKRPYFAGSDKERRTARAQITAGAALLHEAFGSVEVDPVFFRRHGIEDVPMLVLEDEAGVIARVHGAVTLSWALEAMADRLAEAEGRQAPGVNDKRLEAARGVVIRTGCRLMARTFAADAFAGVSCEEAMKGRDAQ